MKKIRLDEITKDIEEALGGLEDLRVFKIGKTDNLCKRYGDYSNEGYSIFNEIAHGSSQIISDLEKSLIAYFKKQSNFREENDNKNIGGGNPKADYLYIAVKAKIPTASEDGTASINDLDSKILPNGYPLGIVSFSKGLITTETKKDSDGGIN